MKVLIIGEKGQLAWELANSLKLGSEVVTTNSSVCDIRVKDQVQAVVKRINPDLVINASAYNDVDKAETDRENALAINGDGPGWLSQACQNRFIPIIHYSSDFVYDGTKLTPYDEEDIPNPVNYYGQTKLLGESAVLNESCAAMIFRLAWLYSSRGSNFVRKILYKAKTCETVRVVDDQVGNPTWARLVAEITRSIILQPKPSREDLYEWFQSKRGIFNLSTEGCASRFDWANYILRKYQERTGLKSQHVSAAKSDDFVSPARRPKFTVLSKEKLKKSFGVSIPTWKSSFDEFFENESRV